MKYLLSLLTVALIVGCAEKGPDPKVEENRVEAAVKMREMYDKYKGNYDMMTAVDKDELLKQFGGDEAKAKQMWTFIQTNSQGSAPTTGPSTGR